MDSNYYGYFLNTGVYCVPFTPGLNFFLNVCLHSLYKFTITDIAGVPCLKKQNKQITVIQVFLFLKISVWVLLVRLFFELPNLQLGIRKENLRSKPEESLCILIYWRYSCTGCAWSSPWFLWMVWLYCGLSGLWRPQRCPRHSCFLSLQALLVFSNCV